MAEVKIDIPGVGEVTAKNAASEQTLKEILKAVGGGTKNVNTQMGQTGGMGGGAVNTKKAQQGLDQVGESAYSASGALSKLASAGVGLVGGAINGLLAGASALTGTFTGLAQEAMSGSVRMSDYAQYLPGVGAVAKALDQQLDTFRDLSSSGAAFGNDMFNLSIVAGRSAIPIQDFTELVGSNSEMLRRFGGTVSDGVTNFGRLSKEFRQSTIGQQLMGMGFTTKELNENLINYNDMMVFMGKREMMTDQQLIAGAQAYSFELDRIAKLTGRSRKEIEEEMNSRNTSMFQQAATAKMSADQVTKFNTNLALLPPQMGMFKDALVDMADDKPFTPLARRMVVMSETFRQKAVDIKNMKPEEITKFYQDVEKEIREYQSKYGDDQEQFLRSIANTNPELAEVFENMAMLKGITFAQGEAAKREQEERDKATTKIAGFEEGIASAIGLFKAELLESDMFKDFKKLVGETIPSIEGFNKAADEAMKYWNTNIFPEIQRIYEWWKSPEGGVKLIADIKDFIDTLITDITPKVKEFVDGLSTLFSNLSTEEGRQKIWEGIKKRLASGVSSIFENFDWVAFGGTLLLALTKLNPFGALASTLIAGIVGFIGWDNIKQFFSIENLQQGVGKAVQTMINGVLDFFSIDISLPNFSDFLPRWLGGKGRSLKDLFKGETYEKIPKIDEEKAEEEVFGDDKKKDKEKETDNADNDSSTSSQDEQLVMLNTKIQELIDINRKHFNIAREQTGTV